MSFVVSQMYLMVLGCADDSLGHLGIDIAIKHANVPDGPPFLSHNVCIGISGSADLVPVA